MSPRDVPPIRQPSLLLTVEQAAHLLGVGRTLMYELLRTGQVTSVRVGRLRRIRPADLAAYAEELPVANRSDATPRAA